MIVTIDGVAASGKSSVAARVASELGYPYVSSGLLYRAVACLAQRHGTDLSDPQALLALVHQHPLDLRPHATHNEVWCGRENLTGDLHTDSVDAAVSRVARHGPLREWVNSRLRALPGPFVAEGRDMGTAVFPDAPRKFYLTASPEVRAARRVQERREDVRVVEAALRERDANDAVQSAPAPDAHLIDTGDLSLDEVVRRILGLVRA